MADGGGTEIQLTASGMTRNVIDLVVTIDCWLPCRNLPSLSIIGMAGSSVMNRYSKVVAVLMLLMFGAVASGSAMARGGRGGGGHFSGGHFGGGFRGGSVGFGIALGVPLYGLGYYSGYYPYPAYAYPPAYGYPAPAYAYPGPAMAPSGAYAEQGYAQAAPAPAPAQQQDWYYCADSKSYYPYVRECPAGWQRVPSQPSR